MAISQAFFTTSGGASAGSGLLAGLYSCTVNNGTCVSTPSPVLQDWRYEPDSELFGLALSHVQYTSKSIYAQLQEGTSAFGFQVIQADMTEAGVPISSQVLLQANDDQGCLDGEYFEKITITDFVVAENGGNDTDDEIYVSWQGYYNSAADCSAATDDTAVWTIGISKVDRSNEQCKGVRLESGGNFANCTSVVATYSDETCVTGDPNRTKSTLGSCVNPDGHSYANLSGGLARALLRGEPYFFYTAFDASQFEHGNPTILETVVLTMSPNSTDLVVSDFTQTEVEPAFLDWRIGDLGMIKIFNSNQDEHLLCQSIMDQGIHCQGFRINSAGAIQVENETNLVVEADIVAEHCPTYESLLPFVTGFDVVMGSTGQPQRTYFGCLTGIGGLGNFVIVDHATGHSKEAESGFYPGSIDFPDTDSWLAVPTGPPTASPTAVPTGSPTASPTAEAPTTSPSAATTPSPTSPLHDWSIGAIVGIAFGVLVGIFLCNGIVFFILRLCARNDEVTPDLPK